MISWRTLPDEKLSLYSPIGLRLIDDFTGRPPIGQVDAYLDASDGAGGWRPTEVKATRTLSGQIAYPRLERRANVVGVFPKRYRVRIRAEFYKPLYELNADGIEFDAFPYNDANPPMDYRLNPPLLITPRSQDVRLLPAVNYPFPTYVRVLRGKIVNAAGSEVVNAEVTRGNTERAASGERGAFALPLRTTPNNSVVPIDANDLRTGQTGTINVTLPQALRTSQTITIS